MKIRQFLLKFLEKYRKFMYGRYGTDELTYALILLSVIFSLISNFDKLRFFYLISILPLAVAIWRTLSRNTNARYNERLFFIKIISVPKSKLKNIKNRIRDRKSHKYFTCKNCKATLRLPKGRGKINITCPKCGAKMIKKT